MIHSNVRHTKLFVACFSFSLTFLLSFFLWPSFLIGKIIILLSQNMADAVAKWIDRIFFFQCCKSAHILALNYRIAAKCT